MKKLIILASKGMAGNCIYSYLKSLNKYHVYGTARNSYEIDIIPLDIEQRHCLDQFIDNLIYNKIDIVINCIGLLVKPSNDNPDKAIYINAWFPHYLEQRLEGTGCKIIHLSTDCVFDGDPDKQKGINYGYTTEKPNAKDWYGKSKAMGELNNDKDLTIRKSIIGKELKEGGSGLFEWTMRQEGTIEGYTESIWSGMTTLELAKAIDDIIENQEDLAGLIQLAPPYNISKYDLLCLIKEVWNKKIDVRNVPGKVCDKTLINSHDLLVYNFPKDYKQMLIEYKEYLDGQK